MHGQKGEAIKILYQIKMVFISYSGHNLIVVGEEQQEIEIKVGFEENSSIERAVWYDAKVSLTLYSHLFMKKLKEIQPAQKTVDLKNNLEKYEVFQVK